MKLDRAFFARNTLIVAQKLLGKKLFYNGKNGIITETEAYIGTDDPACHARFGMTKRNKVMFGQAGYTYVYLIYGMYYCLNFVTESVDFPAAVLIRGVMADKKHYDGPGKLCRYYNISTEQNNLDIIDNDNFYLSDTEEIDHNFIRTSRIGIKNGVDKLWRFVITDYA
ncbi:MAG: DNA-3-methyladenine glycosylase [Rickettsiaceae bacterium H1]|nr:DNA-3-methyladenine glycosylase [Rickettsiaceae bacterium H1]